jgi:hypothetical protein
MLKMKIKQRVRQIRIHKNCGTQQNTNNGSYQESNNHKLRVDWASRLMQLQCSSFIFERCPVWISSGQYLHQAGSLLPNYSQFIIHHSFQHSTLYNERYWQWQRSRANHKKKEVDWYNLASASAKAVTYEPNASVFCASCISPFKRLEK